jgi:hypothetical protein
MQGTTKTTFLPLEKLQFTPSSIHPSSVTRDQKLQLVDYPNTPNNKKKFKYLVARVVEIFRYLNFNLLPFFIDVQKRRSAQ